MLFFFQTVLVLFTDVTTPAPTTAAPTDGPAAPAGLTTAQIVGIVLGSVALLLIIIIIIVVVVMKCSKKNKIGSEPDMESARNQRGRPSSSGRRSREGEADRIPLQEQ